MHYFPVREYLSYLPVMYERLDIEPKCWAYGHDVLIVQFLEDRGLPCVVQPS